MFDSENKMGGLTLLYASADINAVLKWAQTFYKDKKVYITSPLNGLRYFKKNVKDDNYEYSSIIIQENKRYKVYG